MADSFFGFDTSASNINDEDGGGGDGSEDEYDALNDETFGQADEYDWEQAHEQLAHQLESSRRYNSSMDDSMEHSQLEASLSQLVLDETDAPHNSSAFGPSQVWQHDVGLQMQPTPAPAFKNVCTVEELERQLRQKQPPQPPQVHQNYYQPRFPPVILQRPPGLQAPVPLPFAPQHNMGQGMGQNMGQLNQMQNNQMGPMGNQNMNQFMQNQFPNLMNQQPQTQMGPNHMGPNQMGPNQMGPNQMGPNQMGPNQMGPNQMGPNQMGPNQMGLNQMGPNQMGPNQMGPNQMAQNQMAPNHIGPNQMGLNQMGPNQMVPNGNQFGPNMNQFQHMMNQPRMMPPPGLNMPPRQNFSPNIGQFNPNFRGPKPLEQQTAMSQQNMMLNQQQQQNMQQNMQQQQQTMQQQQQTMQQQQQTMQNQQQNKTTQSPQMKQTQPLAPNQRSPAQQKIQKQRVIYNSNQKNLPNENLDTFNLYNNKNPITSENLVQYIQNTHPILQMNNSFHNAHHHPMLNNRGVQQVFNGNQMMNHPMFNSQRVNGNFSNNNRDLMNGDEIQTNGIQDGDEYAGLMTQREKQWLINIQMIQLNTGTPYLDDFYYTVFLERQSRKEKEGIKEAHKANQQNHPFYSGGVKQESHNRERHNSQRHNSQSEDVQPRTYVPTQFENSLGKLQCGSVTAPRKIIDVDLVQGENTTPGSQRPSRAPSVASTTNPHEVPREVRRTKQLLLDIESLYLILLRLEELNEPLAISNALILKEREEKQKLLDAAAAEGNVFLRNIESVQRRRTDSPKPDLTDKRQVVNLTINPNPPPTTKNLLDENKDELINKMFLGLLHEDRVQQFMMVRKGKTLLARLLARTPPAHPRLRQLWSRALRALSSAARRDDGTLAALARPYALYIENSAGWPAVLESCALLGEAFDPARTPHALTSALTLSCICSLVEKATTLVSTPEATANERHWTKFLKTFARALKNTTVNVARPVKPLPESKLALHIKQLESRSTIEILQRGRTAAEFADLSKSEFAELLLRHLC